LVDRVPASDDSQRSSNSSTPVSYESDDASRVSTHHKKFQDTKPPSSGNSTTAPKGKEPEKPPPRKARPAPETRKRNIASGDSGPPESRPEQNPQRDNPMNCDREKKQIEALQKPLQPSDQKSLHPPTIPGLSQAEKSRIKSGKPLESLLAGASSAAGPRAEPTGHEARKPVFKTPASQGGPSNVQTPSPARGSIFNNPMPLDKSPLLCTSPASSSSSSSGGVLLSEFPSLLDSTAVTQTSKPPSLLDFTAGTKASKPVAPMDFPADTKASEPPSLLHFTASRKAPTGIDRSATTSNAPAPAKQRNSTKQIQAEKYLVNGLPATDSAEPAADGEHSGAFYYQFCDVFKAFDSLECPEEAKPPRPNSPEATADTEFKSVVSGLHKPSAQYHPNNAETNREISSADTKIGHRKTPPPLICSRAARPFDRRPPYSLPEWDLPRCFNCWEEGHYPQSCPHDKLTFTEKEEKRQFLGVISRKWTEEVVLSATSKWSTDVVSRHHAYRRIWQPYTSEVTGRYVSYERVLRGGVLGGPNGPLQAPAPNFPGSNAGQRARAAAPPTPQSADQGSQTEESPSNDKGVQTDLPITLQITTSLSSSRTTTSPATATSGSSPSNENSPTNGNSPPNPWLKGMVPREKSKPIIIGKNNEECWRCGKYHSRMEPCGTSPRSTDEDWEWDEARWEAAASRRIQKSAVLPKNNALQRPNLKSRVRRSEAPLSLKYSKILTSATTMYRIEDDGDKEVVFDRDDLGLLDRLDREARDFKKRFIVISDDEDDEIPENPPKMSSLLRCPTEILESIFQYAADDALFVKPAVKVKDIIAGHDFRIDDELSDQVRRARNLSGAAKSCRRLRAVAQSIIYKVVCFDQFKSLQNFARSITRVPDLGKIVQVVRITMDQGNISYRQQGGFKYQLNSNKSVASRNDFAALFVRVVENCPNMQILVTKMFGSLLGFATIRGRWSQMREICISDPVSTGQVLNRMWNQLPDFPRLKKFKIIHSSMNDHVDFEGLEIQHHMADKGLSHMFNHLNTLTLEMAPEVSDTLLFFLVRRLPVLTKLAIVNCKLVTSGGEFLTLLTTWCHCS
jgi:hypothetical protein